MSAAEKQLQMSKKLVMRMRIECRIQGCGRWAGSFESGKIDAYGSAIVGTESLSIPCVCLLRRNGVSYSPFRIKTSPLSKNVVVTEF